MSKSTNTMMAAAAAALVGSAALAQQAQWQQGATGTGAAPADQQNYQQNYTDQAQWMRQRAMEQYALEKQTCNTLRHQSPKEEEYERCLQQAEAARNNAGRGAAGPGSTSVAGSQGQEGQAQQGSDQGTGVLDKMKKAVTNTLAEIGIGSGSNERQEGQGGGGQSSQGSSQQQGFAQGQWSGQPQQGYTQGTNQQGAPGGQGFGFGQGQGSSGQQQGFAQGQGGQQGFAQGQWGGQPQQGSTQQGGGQGSAKDQGGGDQVRWNADPKLVDGGLTESKQYLLQHGVMHPTAYALELGNREYSIQHQYCKTVQYQNPQAYDQCEQQAQTNAVNIVKSAVAAIAGS